MFSKNLNQFKGEFSKRSYYSRQVSLKSEEQAFGNERPNFVVFSILKDFYFSQPNHFVSQLRNGHVLRAATSWPGLIQDLLVVWLTITEFININIRSSMKWNPAGNDRVVICLDIIVGIIRLCIDMELISIARISPPSWAQSIIFTLLIDDVFPSPLMMISLSRMRSWCNSVLECKIAAACCLLSLALVTNPVLF